MRDLYIGGEWTDATADASIDVTSPSTGNREVVDTVPDGSAGDVAAAIEAAQSAYDELRERSVYDRVEIIESVATYLDDHREAIAETMTREEGKPLAESRTEVTYTVESAPYHAHDAIRLFGDVVPAERSGRFAFTKHVPYGPAAIVTPWNFPLELPAENVFAAVLAGNPVVAKPAEETPLSAYYLAEAFDAVDCPDGTFNLVTGGAETGAALVGDPDVRLVSFTGSVEAGREVARNAAGNMAHLHLELGGKDPVLVFGDADLDWAADRIVFGSNANAGQVCCGTERVIVTADVHDELVDRVRERTEALRVGDPFDEATDVGPMVAERIQRTVVEHVEAATADGARLLTGGAVDGLFFEPAVVDGVTSDMALAQEETFGPVTPFVEAADLDEAVAIANRTRYGLQAAVFTRDVQTAFEAIDRIEAGGVFVNESDNYWQTGLPFGGHRQSGTGRVGNLVEEFTQNKSALINYADW